MHTFQSTNDPDHHTGLDAETFRRHACDEASCKIVSQATSDENLAFSRAHSCEASCDLICRRFLIVTSIPIKIHGVHQLLKGTRGRQGEGEGGNATVRIADSMEGHRLAWSCRDRVGLQITDTGTGQMHISPHVWLTSSGGGFHWDSDHRRQSSTLRPAAVLLARLATRGR